MKHVTATVAKSRFSELIAEVVHTGQQILIERRGRPVAALVSIEDLGRLGHGKSLQARPLGALGLIGAWGDLGDEMIDQITADIYSTRDQEQGRPVIIDP